MKRIDIINTIGSDYLTSNIETGEFSYKKALKEIGKNYKDYLTFDAKRKYQDLDMRFSDNKLTVLVETKSTLSKGDIESHIIQLKNYVSFERQLTNNKIIAILASTSNDEVKVWLDDVPIDELYQNKNERVIKTFTEYSNLYFGKKNNKLAIIQSTYQLNELLHQYGINEKIRSQFVGTCLLALKNNLTYSLEVPGVSDDGKVCQRETLTNKQIRDGIEDILTNLLNKDLNKAEKLVILKNKVLDSQDVRELKIEEFKHILRDIENNILPHINDQSTMGQDLLNLFFTTFNKYVGKSDKNQAFTPDHIVHFMCKAVGINRNSIVLDPCCGSGAF